MDGGGITVEALGRDGSDDAHADTTAIKLMTSPLVSKIFRRVITSPSNERISCETIFTAAKARYREARISRVACGHGDRTSGRQTERFGRGGCSARAGRPLAVRRGGYPADAAVTKREGPSAVTSPCSEPPWCSRN